MSAESQITVKDVLDAYKYITEKPIRKRYFSCEGVCGITALYLKNHQFPNITGAVNSSVQIEEWAYRTFGRKNAEAFVFAFDGLSYTCVTDDEKHFYEVGKEASRQLGLIPFSER